jgi:hypothetical protein
MLDEFCFDLSKTGKFFTRCKSCRENHNERSKNSYEKKLESFASYDGLTSTGKRKVDCWDYEKNGDVKPEDVSKGTHKKFWFKCDNCPHSFIISLSNLNQGQWCPYCVIPSKKRCDGDCLFCFNKSFSSFEGLTPSGKRKVDCWDYEKNGDVKPDDVAIKSNKKIWFKCDVCPHSFHSLLNNVSSGLWCPFCSSKTLCQRECDFCFQKSFASFDEVTPVGNKKIDCWEIERNGEILPINVFKSSGKIYSFKCDQCYHVFDSPLRDIITGNWCSYCSSHKLCDNDCNFCYNKSFASFEGLTPSGKRKVDYWDYDKNGSLLPINVFKTTRSKIHFICDKCFHSFDAMLSCITKNGSWCPYCSNTKRCSENCQTCFDKSFASFDGLTPEGEHKVDCWDIDKNKGILPRMVAKQCNKKFWFRCKTCKHSFEHCLTKILRGDWCPYCSNHNLCNDECDFCFQKSFASYVELTPMGNLKVDCWDNEMNGGELARNVAIQSGRKVWFRCDKCIHLFNLIIGNVIKGQWCPFCSNRKICKDDCDVCFQKSFASFEGLTPLGNLKVDCWDYDKNKLRPRDVFKQCNKKSSFKCDNCNHSFNSTLNCIVGGGTWCPHCKHKTELKLLTFLKEMFTDVITQFSPEWCRNPKSGKLLRFDFYIPSLNLLIELDGEQHFRQVANWTSPEETNIRDVLKMEKALEQGMSMIRILQMEVSLDKFDWQSHLLSHCIPHETPEILTICESGDYPIEIPRDLDVSALEFNDDSDEDAPDDVSNEDEDESEEDVPDDVSDEELPIEQAIPKNIRSYD